MVELPAKIKFREKKVRMVHGSTTVPLKLFINFSSGFSIDRPSEYKAVVNLNEKLISTFISMRLLQ